MNNYIALTICQALVLSVFQYCHLIISTMTQVPLLSSPYRCGNSSKKWLNNFFKVSKQQSSDSKSDNLTPESLFLIKQRKTKRNEDMQKKMWSLHFYTVSVKFQTQPDSNLEIRVVVISKRTKWVLGKLDLQLQKKKNNEIELYPYTMLKTSLKMDQTAKCKR